MRHSSGDLASQKRYAQQEEDNAGEFGKIAASGKLNLVQLTDLPGQKLNKGINSARTSKATLSRLNIWTPS